MRASVLALAAALAAAPVAGLAKPASAAQCDTILPSGRPAHSPRRLVPEDLVRLRDIGPAGAESFAAPLFTISPDGTRVAFQLRRADPGTNSYCLAMIVLGLSPRAGPIIADEGGDLLLLAIDSNGTADFPTGIPEVITPRWSPEGRWIAFLKRTGSTTQVWRANADGSGSAPLTRSPVDVVDFRIAANGQSLVYSTRPGLEEARKAIAEEGLSGYHYDDRWAPTDGRHPFPAPPIARSVQVLDLATNEVREANPAERAMLAGDSELIVGPGPAPAGAAKRGAWISAMRLAGGAEEGALHALGVDGTVESCGKPECAGAYNPWLLDDGLRVRFFRREGWADASTAIYEWRLDSGEVRRLYVTDDVLADCAPAGEELLCLRDSSLSPRRLERLDPSTGKRETLFDPNPEFEQLKLGKVRRMHWRNASGLEAIGDLVLPVGYRPGKSYPLIVVQYQTRGFLRGGTGDEYPIQAFANRGYAVLSVQRPAPIALFRGARTYREGDRLNLAGFADHKSVFSSLETGVRLLIAKGIADPKRLGITGLSNGATNAVWALLHSSLFSAAAMSSCCFDTTLAMRVGPLSAREYEEMGYPGMLERNSPFWDDLSLSVNARRIHTPILLQVADFEYLNALETYTSLREAGDPIDMFVFPGEHHNKSQPAHRLAVYQRSLDWFDYWLRGIRSKAPGRQAELRHWDELHGRSSTPSN
jgi:dipeptidyl aminopeptidase/acylaminoacyl peptidase